MRISWIDATAWEDRLLRLPGATVDGKPLPLLRYAFRKAKRLSTTDLFFQTNAGIPSHYTLPALLWPLLDTSGQDVPFETIAALCRQEATSEIQIRQAEILAASTAEDRRVCQALWLQGFPIEQGYALQTRLGLVEGIALLRDERVMPLTPHPQPRCFLHPLPRVVSYQRSRIADNTDAPLSMDALLQRFVHRFSHDQTRTFSQIAVATAYLYQRGFQRLLALLDKPAIHTLRLLFSGQGDKPALQLLQEVFLDPLDGEDETQIPTALAEAVAQGRLQVRVYPHGFLHAKLYLGWDGFSDDGYPDGLAILGSSNLTGPGMLLGGNLELNLSIEERHSLKDLMDWFEARWEEAEEIRPELLDALEYRKPPPDLPLFQTPGLFDLWKAGQRHRFQPPSAYLAWLASLYHDEIRPFRLKADLPAFRFLPDRQITPAPEQESGVFALALRLSLYRQAFLADSVGLGKTITALGTAWYLAEAGEIEKAALIAPRKLFAQWERDRDRLRMPKAFLSEVNRHILERRSPSEIEDTLLGCDLLIVEEAHEILRSRTNQLWLKLRRYLKDHPRTKLLLISATPWNNRREDIFNYLLLGWQDGFSLSSHFPGLLLPPAREWLSLFRSSSSRSAKTFEELDLPRYRSIFSTLFVQRTRHRIAQLYQKTIDFPQRQIHPHSLPPHQDYDSFFDSLAQRIPSLQIPYRDPFASLSLAWASLLSSPPSTPLDSAPVASSASAPLDSAPVASLASAVSAASSAAASPAKPDSKPKATSVSRSKKAEASKTAKTPRTTNLHKGFLIRLYKRAESSLFALAISLQRIALRLQTIEDAFQGFLLSDAPAAALTTWLQAELQRPRRDPEDTDGSDDRDEEIPPEERALRSRTQVETFVDALSSASLGAIQDLCRTLLEESIRPDLQIIRSLQTHLTPSLEEGSPKSLFLQDQIRSHRHHKRKLLLIAGYSDTAFWTFLLAIKTAPQARIALVLGGDEGWLYDPTTCSPTPFTHDDWKAALSTSAPAMRKDALTAFHPSQKMPRAWPHRRASLLAAFAPHAQLASKDTLDRLGGPIDILIGSEAISLGQNLQDATSLIHLDLPWNPMVLEQRIGRIDRRGGGRPEDPDDPTSPKIVDVFYCWSSSVIDKEIALRKRLTDKTQKAIQDTDFDEILLHELSELIHQIRASSSPSSPDTENQRLADFLRQRQRQLAEEQCRPSEIASASGSKLEGLRHLALWLQEQPLEDPDSKPSRDTLRVAPSPQGPRQGGHLASSDSLATPSRLPSSLIAVGLPSTDSLPSGSWLLTVSLQPLRRDQTPLGPPLVEHLLWPSRSASPQDDFESLVLALAAAQPPYPSSPLGASPSWLVVCNALDRNLQAFRASRLASHNRSLHTPPPLSKRSPRSELQTFRELCLEANAALEKELRRPFYEQPEQAAKIEAIEAKLSFLLNLLTPQENHRLYHESDESGAMEAALESIRSFPSRALTSDFETLFSSLAASLWEDSQHPSSPALQPLPLDHSSFWDDLHLSILAAAYIP